MLRVHCSGSSTEIGLEHGKAAREQILRGLEFYKAYYVEKARIEWPQAVEVAMKFMPFLESDWPDFVAEMRGVAEGAGLQFEDILAMNVRSEIAMGMMTTDGCTALSYHSASTTLLAQNWDWDTRQQPNLIALTLHPTSGPSISMITEAGLIGKIGLNASHIGVCLNAIRIPGVCFTKLPVHLALRAALNSTSALAAIRVLEKVGVASACHILIADARDGGMGLEFSSGGLRKVVGGDEGWVTHTNHYLERVPGLEGMGRNTMLKDSPARIERIGELLREGRKKGKEIGVADVEAMLEDEEGWPVSINRSADDNGEGLQTLFSVVMDLRERKGWVRVGRPTEGGERVLLSV